MRRSWHHRRRHGVKAAMVVGRHRKASATSRKRRKSATTSIIYIRKALGKRIHYTSPGIAAPRVTPREVPRSTGWDLELGRRACVFRWGRQRRKQRKGRFPGTPKARARVMEDQAQGVAERVIEAERRAGVGMTGCSRRSREGHRFVDAHSPWPPWS